MRKSIIVILTCLASQGFAHEHREHGTHVHGSAEMSIAFDGNKGQIDFKSPSDSTVGFEHKPGKNADKKKIEDTFKKIETNIANMIIFDSALKCQFTKEKIETAYESDTHSDTVINYKVLCAKSPVGSTLTFNFQKYFPALKDIDAQVLIDSLQKSVEIRKDGTKLELK
jgi:hypothetical protein